MKYAILTFILVACGNSAKNDFCTAVCGKISSCILLLNKAQLDSCVGECMSDKTTDGNTTKQFGDMQAGIAAMECKAFAKGYCPTHVTVGSCAGYGR